MQQPDNKTVTIWENLTDCYKDPGVDYISPADMKTLPDLFSARVTRSPDKLAYSEYSESMGQWKEFTWEETSQQVQLWRNALGQEDLQSGDRVGIRRGNGYNWVLFDQAALSLGLVVVPLYVNDRAENIAYIIKNAGIKLLYLETQEQWDRMAGYMTELKTLCRVLIEARSESSSQGQDDDRVMELSHWIETRSDSPVASITAIEPDTLATIVYTAGTTGNIKGVMLSHRNILSNIISGLARIAVYPSDRLLSFLPLSHTLERTVGYYLSICAGNEVVYARSVDDLAEDLVSQRPTIIVSVPRIFEKVYSKINAELEAGSALKQLLFKQTVAIGWRRFEQEQNRAEWNPKLLLWPLLNKFVASKVQKKFGGNMRFAISGGAPIPSSISKVFIGLGINILQGYGQSETSPIISVNTLESNNPASIGVPLKGVEVKIGEHDELLAHGNNVMLGYWNNQKESNEVLQPDGWIKTGDQASIRDGMLFITGRLKEIIVLANGEKIPPASMESAIVEDELFEQSMIVGEQKAYLSVIVVLNKALWLEKLHEKGKADTWTRLDHPEVEEYLVARVKKQIVHFPGYARIHRTIPLLEPWTVENGLLSPNMKIKRKVIETRFARYIDELYDD